jgi:hypothetical protein
MSDSILKLGNFILSLLYLFFPKNKVRFFSNSDKLFIKQAYICHPHSNKLPDPILYLTTKLDAHNNGVCKFKNICVIKSSSKVMNSPDRSFNKEYIEFFKEKGFEIIQAELYEIIDLYNIIHNCENIIISWGCNAWINSTFVNINSNVICLCHEKYNNEYNVIKDKINNSSQTLWTPICKKLTMIYDLKSELNETLNAHFS